MGKIDIEPDLMDGDGDDNEAGEAVEIRLPVTKAARRRLEDKIEEMRLRRMISDYDFDI